MKILVVCQYYYPEPFRITDICETLGEMGHKVTVLTGLPNYPEGRVLDEYRYGRKRKEILNGVNVIRTLEIGRGKNQINLFINYLSFAASASLKALFIKEEFDVVFVNQLSPIMMAMPAMIYKNKHKKKMVLYCLDLWPDSLAAGGIKETSVIYKLFFKISKRIYKSADIILVTSSMFKMYFENTLGMLGDNIKHLPQYAEDLYTIKATQDSNDTEMFNFVFAGNIGDMQSVETIIEAANKLQTYSEIAFHIVGDGSKLEECKRLSDNYKLKNVTFYGRQPVEEMPYYYGMADAMLITLKDNKVLSYTLPGKLQSYMAAGKPVIGCINGEATRIIEESGCGLCCAAEDHQGLADLVLQFCKSDKKEEMGKNAQKYYAENYSKKQFMQGLEKVLLDLGD